MYLINMTNNVRKAASLMSLNESFVSPMRPKRRLAPLSVTGTGTTSAFGTVGSPTTAVVIADSHVRDANQAAPPRGHRC